jgi:chemotaxis-related protein WspD
MPRAPEHSGRERRAYDQRQPKRTPVADTLNPIVSQAPAGIGKGEADEIQTCWNRIGVYGNSSCAELQKFIHCRNCGIFSSAAHRLLDRPLSQEYRREWTAHFAQEKKRAAPAKLSAVIFRISDEWLALPTQSFQEVAERRRIHSLPHRRHGIVLGVVNIRGELLICVTLGRLLGLDRGPARQTARTIYDRLLVASWEGARLVFPVDEVHGIYRFQSQELREPPATVAKSKASFSEGILPWREKAVGYLNPGVLFSSLNRSLS